MPDNVATEALPDEDTACPYCLGAGQMCVICERTPLLCHCAAPALWHCGVCQGTGEGESDARQ